MHVAERVLACAERAGFEALEALLAAHGAQLHPKIRRQLRQLAARIDHDPEISRLWAHLCRNFPLHGIGTQRRSDEATEPVHGERPSESGGREALA